MIVRPSTSWLAAVGAAFASVAAHANLAGTTLDVRLQQDHPTFGYDLSFEHVYGTTSTVFDPPFPQFPIDVTTPGGAVGREHSLVVDFSDNQYGDFAGTTSSITVSDLAEPIDAPSAVLVNEASQIIGTVVPNANAIVASWPVDDVLGAGTGTRVFLAWDSVAVAVPNDPQPRMGEPLNGLSAAELDRFDAGRAAFSRVLTETEGLGPIFNQFNCAGCHSNPIGGPGGQTVMRFGRTDKGVFTPLDASGGSLLQSLAIDERCAETVPPEANTTALRVTNGALGYGLIEAIPDADILAIEQDPPGVSGRAHLVEALEAPGVPRVGRFGWKAQLPTILSFSADAALNEMGLTNRLLMAENDPNGAAPPELPACDTVADPEDGPDLGNGVDFIDRVTDFQRFLAAPPQTPRSGMSGEAVFQSIGCAGCHHSSFVTADDPRLEPPLRSKAIRPYSDFLLHDMGLGADFIAQGQAGPRELRTPPLWGLRTRDPLWHDGRFGGGTLAERTAAAIAEHGLFGSEAIAAAAAYDALTAGEQAQLVRFLDSLGRVEFDMDGDGDVGLDDFNAVLACAAGGPYTSDDECAVADFDQDGDVDGDDHGRFLLAFDGPWADCNGNGVPDLTDIFEGTSLDADANGVPDECSPCPADLDGSGAVGFGDLTVLLSAWGPCTAACPEDLDETGDVGFGDLTELLGNWGDCP